MRCKLLLLMLAVTLAFSLLLVGLLPTSRPLLAATLASSDHSQATVITTTVILTPGKDNTLYESESGDTSNGVGAFFFVGKTSSGEIRRGLIAFDVADQLPAGATVVSATLQLQMTKTSGGPANVALHRALADWGEGTSDASANEGQGAAATPGDATWLYTFSDTALWQTPGGDFAPASTASIQVDSTGGYLWPSSPSMVADVQQWLDDPASDFGWVLIGDESNNKTAKRFTARESGTVANRPQLTVVYTMTGTASSVVYLPLVQK